MNRIKNFTIEPNSLETSTETESNTYSLKPQNENWLRFGLNLISLQLPPALSAEASNSPARSNSPKPAIPHPSVSTRDSLTHLTPRASSGTYFLRPVRSCSFHIRLTFRQPIRPRNQQREETFFLSSTKTFVVSNGSHTTQYMEDFPSHRLHVGVSLQLRNSASAYTCRSNRWDS